MAGISLAFRLVESREMDLFCLYELTHFQMADDTYHSRDRVSKRHYADNDHYVHAR